MKKYFKCRSIEGLVKEANSSKGLERNLTAWQLVLLGVGAIVGAGIFVITGTAAGQHAGPAIVLAFMLSGLACVCAALCYAEMASMIPIAGSSYTYTYATLGEVVAWLIAGLVVLTYSLGASAVASGWSSYFQSLLLDYGFQLPLILTDCFGTILTDADGNTVTTIMDLPALLIVGTLTVVVFFGSQAAALINSIAVYIKMFVLILFVILGSQHIDPANWTPFIPENTGEFGDFGFSGVMVASGIVFLSYTGFDAVATAAQETKNPKRDLPIGIIGSLVICITIYVLISFVLTGVVNYRDLNVAEPMAVAVDTMGMPWFSTLMKIGAVAALTSVVLVLIFGIVRIVYTVTHDGLLPEFLAKTHPKYKTPHVLTFTAGGVIAFLASFVPIDSLVKLANFGTLVTFFIVCFGTIYLRKKRPEVKRSFKCPWVPVIPGIGMFLCAAILLSLPTQIILYAMIWIAFIMVVYILYGRHHSHLLHPHKAKKIMAELHLD